MPFINQKFRLQKWCDLAEVDTYYAEINNSVKSLMSQYHFDLPLVNVSNIVHTVGFSSKETDFLNTNDSALPSLRDCSHLLHRR